jgi:hypothetical protein
MLSSRKALWPAIEPSKTSGWTGFYRSFDLSVRLTGWLSPNERGLCSPRLSQQCQIKHLLQRRIYLTQTQNANASFAL